MRNLDLYLVRHGEPEGGGDFIGSGSDPGLSPAGVSQAEEIARRLLEVRLDAVYTSPLKRAAMTAEAVIAAAGSPGPELRVREDLREIHFGAWEGSAFDDLDGSAREHAERWSRDPRSAPPPGGEDFAEFEERVLRCFDRIIGECSGGSVLVTAHGGSLRVYLSRVLGLRQDRMWSFALARGSVSMVRVYPPRGEVLEFLNLRLDRPPAIW